MGRREINNHKEHHMRREIDRLREELTLVQVQARNPEPTSRSGGTATKRKDAIREEIESLRDEIKMNHTASAASAGVRGSGSYLQPSSPSPVLLPPTMGHRASPYSVSTPASPQIAVGRRSTFQQNSNVVSSRYSYASPGSGSVGRGVGGSGYDGGDRNNYLEEEEEEERQRMAIGHHHHRTTPTPPLRERSSPGIRPQSHHHRRVREARGAPSTNSSSVDSRYYF